MKKFLKVCSVADQKEIFLLYNEIEVIGSHKWRRYE